MSCTESDSCLLGNTSNKQGVRILNNSTYAARRPPRAVGRAVTKLTFSPRKASIESEKLCENVKREWRSMCSPSPGAMKRSCLRSTTPKFDTSVLALANNYGRKDTVPCRQLASPVLRDHRLDIGNGRSTPTGIKLPECRVSSKFADLHRASIRQLPPRYSACKDTARSTSSKRRLRRETGDTGYYVIE